MANRKNTLWKRLGEILLSFRSDKKISLNVVAKEIKIDKAVLSKIERGKKYATRDQVVKLFNYYNFDDNMPLIAWLADKILFQLGSEEVALKAMQVAEESLIYTTKKTLP